MADGVKLHSYPWYISNWRDSVTRLNLSLAERGLYRELLDYCYAVDGSLPPEERLLVSIAATNPSEFRKAWKAVKNLFEVRDGRYVHRKVDEVRPGLIEYHKNRAEAGKRGGLARTRQLSSSSASGSAKTQPEAEARPSRTRSRTTSEVGWLSDLFEEFAALYPAKGRTKLPLAIDNYKAHLDPFLDRQTEHARIIGRMREWWIPSDLWAKGFVMSMDAFIELKRWNEEPERAKTQPHEQQLPTAQELMARDREEQERRAVDNA